MDRKTAAQKLIDIANAVDKQAAEESFFVCHSCNHTASIASINGKRAKVASENGIQDIEAVTVNDVIACPACDGDMRYIPTDMSERYYVEAVDEGIPEEEPKPEDAVPPVPAPKAAPAPTDVPPPAPAADEGAAPAEGAPEEDEELSLDYGAEEDVDEAPAEEDPVEEAPAEEPPAEEPVEPPPAEESPEEPVAEPEPAPKKAPKKKDKPDDKKPNIPKDRVPKFEFPKKAADAEFQALVSKYL